jgi:2-dehydro-3-deoxyphosphogluconate aldolase / (4S)-4-hydroxy-2-oxoglutarate aldolase
MDVLEFKKLPLMGIVRGIKDQNLPSLVEAVKSSGLKALEITLNTKEALSLIKKTSQMCKGSFALGAGTVLSLESCREAIDCGATFIVSPNLNLEIVKYCSKHTIPVFPGAFTPSEIYNAKIAGATMVKVFPAKFFGPAYFKEIKGPFDDTELLACGGVTEENISDFFLNGASAIAFGGSVFKKEWLDQGNLINIIDKIKTLINAYRNIHEKD